MSAKQQGNHWSFLQWGLAIWIGVAVVMMVLRDLQSHRNQAPQLVATSYCRQIISCLKLYADDHAGAYLDSDPRLQKAANEAYRLLLKEGILQDELIFGCPESAYNGDGNIGTAPDYADAVGVNENHWMMVAGLNENSPFLRKRPQP